MHSFVLKTFGGLTTGYYFRQLFFALLFAAAILALAASSPGGLMDKPGLVVISVISTFLYPYSRFVYESIVGFVMGDNVFFVNALFMLTVKTFTMAMCWVFAVFVAPIGLAYLFWRNSRKTSQ